MTYEKRCGGAEMEWTFSEKLKRICNVLSVAYIVFKYCVTNPKVFKVCNIASLFAAASGYIALVVQFVYYLDIIKTYQG